MHGFVGYAWITTRCSRNKRVVFQRGDNSLLNQASQAKRMVSSLCQFAAYILKNKATIYAIGNTPLNPIKIKMLKPSVIIEMIKDF